MAGEAAVSDLCPFCKQPLPPIPDVPFKHVRGWLRRSIVHTLLHHPGISTEDMVGLIYKDFREQPRNAVKSVHVTMVYLRKQVRLDGWEIRSSPGIGGGYRIQRLKSGGIDARGGVSGLRPSEQKLQDNTTRRKVPLSVV